MKTEEKAEKIERSELWHKIYAIVSQIPIKKVSSDAMDYLSASTGIEELMSDFHKQQVEVITDEMENRCKWNTVLEGVGHKKQCIYSGVCCKLIKQQLLK